MSHNLIEKLVCTIVLCGCKAVGYPYTGLRKFARWLLFATNTDWILARKRNTLKFKLVAHKRTPFELNARRDRLNWHGRTTVVAFDIPEEISAEEARILCIAQRIDPWFAELLFDKT